MPRLSDTMEEGNIVSWQKKVGDAVKSGDILAEVETDKATMELESYFDGFMLYIAVESGAVPVDGIIAVIGKKDEEYKHLLSESKVPAAATSVPETVQEVVSMPKTSQPTATPHADVRPAERESTGDTRVKVSPLAKSLAKEEGIELSQVQGTGDQGRITKRDIEQYLAMGKSRSAVSTATPVFAQASSFTYGDVPVSQMRKTIARRLGESKFTAPHFYLTIEVNMDNAMRARTEINEAAEVKISFNDFVVKSCAAALRKHPAVNSSWMGDKITYNRDINIGVAVAVEDGLLVPVIKHADIKTMSQINQEVKELAGKAKTKKLGLEEMQGNTFTISNLGMYNIEEFTAIINPPDACILAVGSIIKKPIVKNDQLAIGNMMKVTLSCDHRVVDGATGAQFLQTLRQYLENPVMMLV